MSVTAVLSGPGRLTCAPFVAIRYPLPPLPGASRFAPTAYSDPTAWQPTAVAAIKHGANSSSVDVVAGSPGPYVGTLLLAGLQAATNYTVYCVTEDFQVRKGVGVG